MGFKDIFIKSDNNKQSVQQPVQTAPVQQPVQQPV